MLCGVYNRDYNNHDYIAKPPQRLKRLLYVMFVVVFKLSATDGLNVFPILTIHGP